MSSDRTFRHNRIVQRLDFFLSLSFTLLCTIACLILSLSHCLSCITHRNILFCGKNLYRFCCGCCFSVFQTENDLFYEWFRVSVQSVGKTHVNVTRYQLYVPNVSNVRMSNALSLSFAIRIVGIVCCRGCCRCSHRHHTFDKHKNRN